MLNFGPMFDWGTRLSEINIKVLYVPSRVVLGLMMRLGIGLPLRADL